MADPDFPTLEPMHLRHAGLYANRYELVKSMKFLRGGIIAEIGVARGDFSEFLIETLRPELFVGFDIFRMHEYPENWGIPSEILFDGKTHLEFYRDRFNNKGAQVLIEVGPSAVKLAEYPDEHFDMIYIDADHAYDGVKQDAQVASQKLKRNGVLIFNDYIMFDHFGNVPYGVVQAVNEMVVQEGWHVTGFALAPHMFCDIAIQRDPPVRVPSHRTVVDVARGGGIGDVLMCTPALRELKRRRPNCRIRFYTNFPSLVRGLPYIDEAIPTEAAPCNATALEYESHVPPPPHLHLSKIIGGGLGVRVTDVLPDCTVDPALVERFCNAWRELPRPHITVNCHASSWTPNKEWPERYWAELIRRLSQDAAVIEIGASSGTKGNSFGKFYVDLRGRTTLEEFVAVVAACDLHVGPVSGAVHIAAATRKRSVVIIGGYEGPSNAAYPRDIALYTPVECSPCWLRTLCPHELRCLNAISPGQVEKAVWDLWHEIGAGSEMAAIDGQARC